MNQTYSFSASAANREQAKTKVEEFAAQEGNRMPWAHADAARAAIDSVPDGALQISVVGGAGEHSGFVTVNASGSIPVPVPDPD